MSVLVMVEAEGIGICFGKLVCPRWARRRSDWPGSGPYREPSYSREDEVRTLKKEAEALKDELNAIERRMGELEAGKKIED